MHEENETMTSPSDTADTRAFFDDDGGHAPSLRAPGRDDRGADPPSGPGPALGAATRAFFFGEEGEAAPGSGISDSTAATLAHPDATVSTGSGTSGRWTVLPRSGRALAEETPPAPIQRYVTKGHLGVGAMGEVLLARDEDIGRDVAIKRMRLDVLHAAGIGRFADEIQVIGQLEHPNIVPIHDVGVDDEGRYFFVMKHVEGETVARIIEKLRAGDEATVRRFTFEARVDIAIALLRALQYAHAQGYVHRDIKPANVMVGRFGEVMLMDWGIAKRVGRPDRGPDPTERDAPARRVASLAGHAIGTPAYMSPEQARGEHDGLDGRSDVYSASALLYELLTLDHYLDGVASDDLLATIGQRGWSGGMMQWQFVTQRPVPPMELYHAVRKGLAFDPADRYQSAEEMIERLQALQAGKVPVQCHITAMKSLTGRVGRFIDRHPMAAFGGALLSLAGSLAAAAAVVAAVV